MRNDKPGEWSWHRKVEQAKTDIHQVFKAENDAWLNDEIAELAEVRDQYLAAGKTPPDWVFNILSSFTWDIYEHGRWDVTEHGDVLFILPDGYAIYAELIKMFDYISVNWGIPSIRIHRDEAGESHLAIVLHLIDYWDDDRHAKWVAEHPPPTMETFANRYV